MRKEFKKNRIDLIFFFNIEGVIQFYPKKIKKIVISYDLVWERFPETMDLTHLIRMKVLAKNFLKNCDRVITISNSTKNDCIEILKLGTPIEVIHLGVDRTRFCTPSPVVLRDILKKYKISKKYILTVGTLEPRKNLVKIIEAFSLLEDKSNYQLVLIGNKGWGNVDIVDIIKLYHIQDETVLTGYVDGGDLNSFYSGAEVFVYTSLYEGFGLPILEAMSCGCPVITSNNSSMPEVANDAAILVDAEDVQQLKNAVEEVLNNSILRTELKTKGFKNINNYSWEKTVKMAISVFENTINE